MKKLAHMCFKLYKLWGWASKNICKNCWCNACGRWGCVPDIHLPGRQAWSLRWQRWSSPCSLCWAPLSCWQFFVFCPCYWSTVGIGKPVTATPRHQFYQLPCACLIQSLLFSLHFTVWLTLRFLSSRSEESRDPSLNLSSGMRLCLGQKRY